MNWNLLARYLIDNKIELRIFNHLENCVRVDWEFFRDLITEKWLNRENSNIGISHPGVLQKIDNNKRKLNTETALDKEKEKIQNKFKSSERLFSGVYELNDLVPFLDFTDPVQILIHLFKNDPRRRIKVIGVQETLRAVSYIYDKRIDQYHPNSSGTIRSTPFTEDDVRQILLHGSVLFRNLGLSDAKTLDYYAENLTELIDEFYENSSYHKIDIFDNLPKPQHIEWGFVGYKDHRHDLIEKLTLGNQRFFQINGQGGSGKSALVNEVANQIKDFENDNLKFKQFIWISSKSDILNKNVITTITDKSVYRNYDDLVRQLFLAINFADVSNHNSFGDIPIDELEKDIIKAINGCDKVKRLIVIDNLENIDEESQERIVSFLERNLDKPNYVVITSRHRVLNFPAHIIDLKGLQPNEGLELLLKFVDHYKVEFKISSKEDKDKALEFASLANNYPLAIKYCVEKSKIESVSLERSFKSIVSGGTQLHEFIFHDTYSKLNKSQKRILQIIVVYKTDWEEDIDRNVLKVIYSTIWNSVDFDENLKVLYQKTLVSYEGINDEDIIVVLSDLITSHVDFIIRKNDIDTSKIYGQIKLYKEKFSDKNDSVFDRTLKTSTIQNQLFNRALQNISSELQIERFITEIQSYSDIFPGLEYLKAKLLEIKFSSNIDKKRKQIANHYEVLLRLKPEVPLFWSDYIEFLIKNYLPSVDVKMRRRIPEILRQYLETKTNENKLFFANILLRVYSLTKDYRNDQCILFIEDAIKSGMKLKYNKNYIPIFIFVAETFISKQNKQKVVKQLLELEFEDKDGASQKSIIIKNNLDLFRRMTEYIR